MMANLGRPAISFVSSDASSVMSSVIASSSSPVPLPLAAAMKNTFSKGSEWRKWDLHVHTSFSELNNNFGDDWDKYIKELFTRAIESNIAVIGITDYFHIEGYKKLKQDYLDNEEMLKKLFGYEEIRKLKSEQNPFFINADKNDIDKFIEASLLSGL